MKITRYKILAGLLAMLCALTTRPALAVTWIYVPDLSQLKYQPTPGGIIDFRNLSDFSTAALYGNYKTSEAAQL